MYTCIYVYVCIMYMFEYVYVYMMVIYNINPKPEYICIIPIDNICIMCGVRVCVWPR